MNEQAVRAKHSGMIIVGGGLIKHHICNANLMVSDLLHRDSLLGKSGRTFVNKTLGLWGRGGKMVKPPSQQPTVCCCVVVAVAYTFWRR